MRAGGRLKHSSLDYDAQRPLILARQHPVTRAIILDYHRRNLHSGPRALLASIRLQFWPISFFFSLARDRPTSDIVGVLYILLVN